MKSGSLRRILSYTYRYKWSFVISVVGFITFAAADIAAVEWIRRIISYIDSEETNLNTLLAMSLIFIAIGRGVGFFVGNYFMSRVGFGIVHDLRAELFQKLHDLPKSYFDANQSGQLINRITFTTTQVSGAASNAVKTLVREGFLLVGLFIYLLILNFKLTLLLIATAPLIALIVYVAGKRLKKLATKIQTAMGDVTHIASEAVDGHVEIKSFNAEEYENNRFFIANTSNKNQNLKLEATGNLATPIIQILVSISLSLVAFFALGSQLGISLDAETFVAFFTAAGLMAKPIRQLSNVNIIIQKGLAAANEIFDQLDQENEDNTGENTNTIEGNIEFKDVSFSYNTGGLIINNVSFKIAKNETVAIVGKSGSGKSTIANLIPRFYNHTSGDIKIDGISVNDYSLKHLRSSISIVNQSPSLFNDTIAKNIAYGDDEIDASRLVECAEQAGCMDFIEGLPEGFESEIGDDGVLLSGGQRQRVAMGRALVRDPKIFLFDEPLSNLDAKLRIEMRREIKKLHKNFKTTMVYVTHDQTEAMSLGTKIAIMNNGKIEQFDTPNNIYNKPNSIFVADFVGSPSMNFISGYIKKDENIISFFPDNEKQKSINLNSIKTKVNNSDEILFGIRPEHIFLKKEHAVRVTKDHNFAEIEVNPELHEYIGHEQIVTFNYYGQEILGKFSSSINIEIDKKMTLFVDLNSVSLFDKETKRRI